MNIFRVKRSVRVSYIDQGYIYFLSRRYSWLTRRRQEAISKLCVTAGGRDYAKALFDFVTTDAGATEVCQRHHLSRSTLERIVRRYYELFPRDL